MKEYTITIALTDEQDAAMVEIAERGEKSVQDILDGLADDHIMGQITQWIADEAKAEFEAMDRVEALAKLRAVPVEEPTI